MTGEDILRVIFFINDAGKPVAKDWLDEQDPGAQAKIYRDLEFIEKYGIPFAGEFVTISKAKKKGIFYIKTNYGGCTYRVFFGIDGDAIVLHGINKKTQEIPEKDIQTAVQRFEKYKNRKK